MFAAHPGKQTEFLASTADYILFGGARGGAKSFSLCYKAAFMPKKYHWKYNGKDIFEYDDYLELKHQNKKVIAVVDKIAIDYPDYQAILIRRTSPQLERNLKPETEKLYPIYGGKWQERNRRYLFPSGAKIYMVHCRDSRALDDYIGGNYNFIGFDEVNQFYEDWVDKIVTSNRTTNPELKPQACYTSNPGNIGHVWLKKRFVDMCRPIPSTPVYNEPLDITYTLMKTAPPYFDENGVSWQYIPSLVFENPSLMENDPAYVLRLKNLKETQKQMWLFGNWGAFAGMFFDKWDEDTHTIDEKLFRYNIDFSVHTHALYRFYDYGTKANFVCLFAAVDGDGNIIVFDEIVETGLASSAQAKRVREYSSEKYGLTSDDFAGDYADPQYWAQISEKEQMPYSPAEHYQDEKIWLQPGVRDRKVGAKIIYDALEPIPKGVPRIRFTSNCTYCIETIPALPSAELDPEDIDTKAEDHAYDALRYGGTIILPGLTNSENQEKGWKARMAKIYSEKSDSVSGSWLSV